MSRYGHVRLLWLVLLAGLLVAFSGEKAEAKEALASWYGPPGPKYAPTASGEAYDPYDYTAAHKTMPFGTDLLVSYKGKSVPVEINDRGPYWGKRELDLSYAAARDLGLMLPGVDYVDWSYAPPDQDGVGSPATTTPPTSDASLPAPALPTSDAGLPAPALPTSDAGLPAPAPPTSDVPPGSPALQETPAGGEGYVVQPGDTLESIAAQLGTSADGLASYNGLADPDLIYDGQTLFQPLSLQEGPAGIPGGDQVVGPVGSQEPAQTTLDIPAVGDEPSAAGGGLGGSDPGGISPEAGGETEVPDSVFGGAG